MNASRNTPRHRRSARAWTPAITLLAVLGAASALAPVEARAFCGFYVASGDAKLFNRASQVVLVRDGDRTVMTLANDFKGEPKEFALVVPVPTVLRQGQIHVGDPALVERIDAFTAPRLVEYFDPSPCAREHAADLTARKPASTKMLEAVARTASRSRRATPWTSTTS
jgi:hypothetical protein